MGKSKYIRFFVALLLIMTFAVPVWGEETEKEARPDPCRGPDAGEIVLDVLIARPLGLASMVVGLAGAIVAYPFALASGSADRVTQKLIYEPYAYTFVRPVGEIGYDYCQK
jgi:hypothetical protein